MDPSVGQWNTPDAYAGEVHDPMSQKPFMWNRNNPYGYTDPSGYHVEPWIHVFIDTWEQLKQSAADRAQKRASELASNLPTDIARRRTTIAVTYAISRTGENHTYVTSSSGGILPKSVRDALKPGETAQTEGMSGVHAEIKGVEMADRNGDLISGVGASHYVCDKCRPVLDARDIKYSL